jgi:hypothetical protein
MSALPAASEDIMMTEDDSMVRYGSLVEDEEDNEIERAAMHKNTFKGRVGRKGLVCPQFHVVGLIGLITVYQDHGIKASGATHQEGSSKW